MITSRTCVNARHPQVRCFIVFLFALSCRYVHTHIKINFTTKVYQLCVMKGLASFVKICSFLRRNLSAFTTPENTCHWRFICSIFWIIPSTADISSSRRKPRGLTPKKNSTNSNTERINLFFPSVVACATRTGDIELFYWENSLSTDLQPSHGMWRAFTPGSWNFILFTFRMLVFCVPAREDLFADKRRINFICLSIEFYF